MPELPEVETIRRQLQARIVGKTVKNVEVLYPKVVHGQSTADFVRALERRKVREVGRQGKLILIRLSGDETLVVHLKMTGRLLLGRAPSLPPSPLTPTLSRGERGIAAGRGGLSASPLPVGEGQGEGKSTEVIFTFTDGTILRYDDWRRFGYMKIVPIDLKDSPLTVRRTVLQIGIDFFDRALTVQKFRELIHSRDGSQIKPLLMDQALISGVGNIYAQEACFAAGVHPTRKAGDLSDKECAALYRALHKIMKQAIKLGGTSADDYRDAFGKMGKFAPHLKVYGREGKPCVRCRTKLLKKNIGGRGTVWCSKCQT